MEIKVVKNILSENERIASGINSNLKEKSVFSIEFLGSPGSGKTTIIESLINHYNNKLKISVIEGDVASDVDLVRIRKLNIPVVLINTENLSSVCHMEANMIKDALEKIDINNTDLLIVENIGNLVCPASFDLGCRLRIVVLSLPEGSDKPIKYPLIFKNSDAVIISKYDLQTLAPFDFDDFSNTLKIINPKIKIFKLSAYQNINMPELFKYIDTEISKFRSK
jgi:hydrogenase nickel incorporation protein HypB